VFPRIPSWVERGLHRVTVVELIEFGLALGFDPTTALRRVAKAAPLRAQRRPWLKQAGRLAGELRGPLPRGDEAGHDPLKLGGVVGEHRDDAEIGWAGLWAHSALMLAPRITLRHLSALARAQR